MHAPPDGPRTLEELLLAVADGDRDAFSDLYDEVAGTVYGLARKVVVDPSRAQEIAQDVLLEVGRKAGAFDPGRGSAITWIAVMTRRRAIDVVRSSESSRSREEKVSGVGGDDPDEPRSLVEPSGGTNQSMTPTKLGQGTEPVSRSRKHVLCPR